uniref:Uncharacterized protein n=1 Tax=Arundo donax TaxID=35708 RepID=A0A0A9GNV2_ARUDO
MAEGPHAVLLPAAAAAAPAAAVLPKHRRRLHCPKPDDGEETPRRLDR